MKHYLTSLLILTLLSSCNSNQDVDLNILPTATNADGENLDTVELVNLQNTRSIKAQFIDFSIEDSEHFTFIDKEGNVWDFSSSEVENFEFSKLLPTSKINETNQGWTANHELTGIWFDLSYYKSSQTIYTDGPEDTILILSNAQKVDPPKLHNFTLNIQSNDQLGEPLHGGMISPNGQIKLKFIPQDHGYGYLQVQNGDISETIEGTLFSPSQIFWSKCNDFVLIHEKDFYANEGTQRLTILNIESKKHISLPTSILLGNAEVGLRNKYNIYNISWLAPHEFSVESSVSYQGYSGHPGIDQNRQVQLGSNFNRSADSVILPSLTLSVQPNYELESRKKSTQYICFNDDESNQKLWIGLDSEGTGNTIKHQHEENRNTLVLTMRQVINSGVYPTTVSYYSEIKNEMIIGKVKHTHSGNWDYIEYTDSKSIIHNYTINHEANPYGSLPCF